MKTVYRSSREPWRGISISIHLHCFINNINVFMFFITMMKMVINTMTTQLLRSRNLCPIVPNWTRYRGNMRHLLWGAEMEYNLWIKLKRILLL